METTRKIPVEIYSRIVGYFRPVNQWNKGMREEFGERKNFEIINSASSIMNDEK